MAKKRKTTKPVKAKKPAKATGRARPGISKLEAPAAATIQEAVDHVLTGKQHFNDLRKRESSRKKEIAEIVGLIREDIGNSVKSHSLNKHAYAVFKSLARHEAEVLAVIWPNLIWMMQTSGLMVKIEAVLSLDLQGGEEGEGKFVDETKSTETTEAVSEKAPRPGPQFGGKVKEIAEQAGAQTAAEE